MLKKLKLSPAIELEMTESYTLLMSSNIKKIATDVANELGLPNRQVLSAVELLSDGNTIPFIARYRKEATNSLDEISLRAIQDSLERIKALESRKSTVLKSIGDQGALTEELRKQIEICGDLRSLEAIYLPFKPKRRTRATIARERGLQPLADLLLKQERIGQPRQTVLKRYIDPTKDVPNAESAIAGALDIVAEVWSENAESRTWLIEQSKKFGKITSKVKRGKKSADGAEKFEQYFDRQESIARVPGTASRETDAFVGQLINENKLSVTKVMVSESGASIYSASDIALKEFPDLDITVRGAISIARRLQDPLAELVKTDPKSIGVGQYQHDVNQVQLKKCLDRVVESCVNHVGVDLNMASAPLLSYVAGIGPKLAENIVEHRNSNGRFTDRKQLTSVAKLGKKAFEQAAGFLRIRDGDQPLDNSAVHPESYSVVRKMAKQLKSNLKTIVGNASLSQKLNANDFVDDQFGLPTIEDIVSELAKPGRDPRSEFRVVKFNDAVNKVEDLKPNMVLEGVITNVTHFGAFVDLGVHQDALIHISQLSNEFVSDPSAIISVGDVVKVKILQIDAARKRISATRKF
jgi:uncharacterized protein